ncbi:MAG: hypothetical protein ACRER4_01870 [Steroidobacteraceae bacterium]
MYRPRRRRLNLAAATWQAWLDQSRRATLTGILGALDPAIESIFPPVTKTKGFTQKDRDLWKKAVEARFLPDYYKKTPGDCGTPAQMSAGKLTPILTAGGKAAVGTAPIAAASTSATFAAAAPFLAIGGGIALAVGIVVGIFKAHHAAAVAKEQGTLCVAVPGANDALSQIDAALRAGQLTAAAASAAYDQVLGSYVDYVRQIAKDNPSHCNAACVYGRMLRGIVAQRKLDLQKTPPAADQGVVAAAAASVGLPPVALYAAAAALLYWLL